MEKKSKPCCTSRRSAHTGVVNVCDAITVHTTTLIAVRGPALSLEIVMPNKQHASLAQVLQAYACKEVTTGIRLANLVAAAWSKAIERDDFENVMRKNTPAIFRGISLLSVKTALYDLVGRCPACRGNGCSGCKLTGLA